MGLAQLQQERLSKTLNGQTLTSTIIHIYQNLYLLESISTRIHVHQNLLFSTNAVIRSIESYRRPSKTTCVRAHALTTKTPDYLSTSFSVFPFSSLHNVLFLVRAIYPQIQIEFILFLRIFLKASSRPYIRLYYNAYRYSYRPSIGIDDLRVARARELLGYLSVSRLY